MPAAWWPGRALHADRHLRGRVAPAADLVRGVDALARRVVGEHERIAHPARGHAVLQEGQAGQGERLVRRRVRRRGLHQPS
jgi:hypothetical protein